MGTYYKFVCEELGECIEPGEMGTLQNPSGGGIKQGPVIHSDVARIVLHYAIHGDWAHTPFQVVGDDAGPKYDKPRRNVTAHAIAMWNAAAFQKHMPAPCKYIPDEEG